MRMSRGMAVSIAAVALFGRAALVAQPRSSYSLEPNAGKWKTWFSPVSAYRVPPPPDTATTRSELESLRSSTAEPDKHTLEQIRFWDAGAPVYRWMNMI